MRTLHRIALLVIGCFGVASAWAAAPEDGKPLMREAWARIRALESERETLDVLVIAAPEKPQYRPHDVPELTQGRRGVVRKRAVRSIRYAPDGSDKLHIVFSEPREDRGTGFLVWRHPSATQDDQWLFLPALKRVRRIPASSTQTFVGTNFTYEDVRHLTGEPLERFDYVLVGEDTVDGHACTLVHATPRADAVTAYASRTIAVAKQFFFPLRVTYHDAGGEPWKVLFNVDVREVAPRVWRPALTELRDLKLAETTVIAFEAREINPTLDPLIFTQDALERWAGE